MPRLNPISRKKFEIFLRLIGCKLIRIKGDHLIYGRVDLKRPIVITADREVPLFIIRNNLRTLGFSIKEYLNCLKQI